MKLNSGGARRRVRQLMVAATAALLLAACGGGERSSDFTPARVIAFGDESSVLDDSAEAGNARKYSINPVFSAQVSCHDAPNWTQYVAKSYGLYFPECSVGLPAGASMLSRMLAQPNADAAAVKAQVDAFLAADTLNSKDLVTLYAGVHDVLNQYAAVQAGTTEPATAVTAAGRAGALLAEQANRLADAGGRVVLSFLPGMEYSPFAVAQEAAQPGDGRRELLRLLTREFNNQLALTLYNDGTRIGLIQFDETMRVVTEDPLNFGYIETLARPACLAANRTPNLLTCTSATVVPEAVGNTHRWMWADETHLSVQGQLALGQFAVVRVTENPF